MSLPSFHVEDVDRAVARAELGQPVADGFVASAAAPRAASASDSAACEQRGQRRRVRAAGPVRRRRLSSRSTGISTCSRPSKRWSTASSPCPPVTIAAACAELDEPLRELRPRPRRRRARAPRAGWASRPSRAGRAAPTSASTASSSSSLAPDDATITGSTTSGTGCSARNAATASIDSAREEHPRLRRVDADVRVDGLELRDDERRRHLVHGGDTDRVLGGQRDDRGHAVRAGRGERLQVGLDPCAAAAVGAGDRQCSRNDLSQLPSPVRTGSGSTGVISAPCGAPR